MKKSSTGYVALYCLMSACMVLLYHTGTLLIPAQAKEEKEEVAIYQVSEQSAGVQDAFCRKAEVVNLESAVAADAVTKTSLIQLNSEDYECLLKIVQSEAGVCDQKGKILVANVVLNRMQSQYFPDTVEGVVYQKNQFSPVENGSIDKVAITEETREAVSMALSGTDYSEGALFFAARSLADQKNMAWFDESLDFLFEHDGHEFFTLK